MRLLNFENCEQERIMHSGKNMFEKEQRERRNKVRKNFQELMHAGKRIESERRESGKNLKKE